MQLAADAELLVSSKAAVSDTSRLEWLGVDAAGKQHQQVAALRALSWVALQQAPALQRLGLELHPNDSVWPRHRAFCRPVTSSELHFGPPDLHSKLRAAWMVRRRAQHSRVCCSRL